VSVITNDAASINNTMIAPNTPALFRMKRRVASSVSVRIRKACVAFDSVDGVAVAAAIF
jgi:hypothetical protein